MTETPPPMVPADPAAYEAWLRERASVIVRLPD